MDAQCSLRQGSGTVQYKQLYHASVERCEGLQQQLERCSQLLAKHKRIAELKNKVLSSLTTNRGLVDSYHESLAQREAELQEKMEECHGREEAWKQDYEQLEQDYRAKQAECEQLRTTCGELLAKAAVAGAVNTVRENLIEGLTTKKAIENEKLKKTFSKYSQSLKHKHDKVKESLEFAESERAILLDSNAELESQLKTLRTDLEKSRSALQQARSELSERRVRTPHPLCLPNHPPPTPSSSCPSCQSLKNQLRLATEALNERGYAKYGDLLHSNFLLQQKVTSLEVKLAEMTRNYQKSVEYIQEYKTRSIEKVNILKENVKKADAEIAELDKLIDMTREALHSHMDLVQRSPHLLKVLIELDGTDVIE